MTAYAFRCIALGIFLGIFVAGWDRACRAIDHQAKLRPLTRQAR